MMVNRLALNIVACLGVFGFRLTTRWRKKKSVTVDYSFIHIVVLNIIEIKEVSDLHVIDIEEPITFH